MKDEKKDERWKERNNVSPYPFSPKFLLYMHICACIDTHVECPSPTVSSHVLVYYRLASLALLLPLSKEGSLAPVGGGKECLGHGGGP